MLLEETIERLIERDAGGEWLLIVIISRAQWLQSKKLKVALCFPSNSSQDLGLKDGDIFPYIDMETFHPDLSHTQLTLPQLQSDSPYIQPKQWPKKKKK